MAIQDGIIRTKQNQLFVYDEGLLLFLYDPENNFDIRPQIKEQINLNLELDNFNPVSDEIADQIASENFFIYPEDQETIDLLISLLYYSPNYKKNKNSMYWLIGLGTIVGTYFLMKPKTKKKKKKKNASLLV
jgi:hypothetical protein